MHPSCLADLQLERCQWDVIPSLTFRLPRWMERSLSSNNGQKDFVLFSQNSTIKIKIVMWRCVAPCVCVLLQEDVTSCHVVTVTTELVVKCNNINWSDLHFALNAAAEGSLSTRFLLIKGSWCRHMLVYGRSGALMRFRPPLPVKWDDFRCETTTLKLDSICIFEQRRAGSETSHLSAYLGLFLHLQLPELNI